MRMFARFGATESGRSDVREQEPPARHSIHQEFLRDWPARLERGDIQPVRH